MVVNDNKKAVRIEGSKTAGTRLNAYLLPDRENYHVTAWDENGKEYIGTRPGEAVLVYDSAMGQIITWKYK